MMMIDGFMFGTMENTVNRFDLRQSQDNRWIGAATYAQRTGTQQRQLLLQDSFRNCKKSRHHVELECCQQLLLAKPFVKDNEMGQP